MFGKRFQLFKLFGIPVQLDISWFLIVVLLSWSLARFVFPAQTPGLSEATYWSMGVAGAVGLFLSILLHEFAHSLVAQRLGVPIRGITLFIFGGVAEMSEEPPSARAEFLIAIAGPLASIVIGLVCLATGLAGPLVDWPAAVWGVFWYLGVMNLILVGFNAIPAFPLDGGRVLRSLLWQLRGNLKWATRITATIGGAFGTMLIVLGAFTFIGVDVVLGMWQFLIGLFLRSAAQMSYQHLLVKRALEGETVSRFMQTNVITVPPQISVQQLVDEYIYRHHHKLFPVLDAGRLIGGVATRDVKQVPRDEWPMRRVADILRPCSDVNTISATADATMALAKMNQNASSRLMVVEDGQLRGIIGLKDLLRFISLKIELEEEAD